MTRRIDAHIIAVDLMKEVKGCGYSLFLRTWGLCSGGCLCIVLIVILLYRIGLLYHVARDGLCRA